MSDEMMRQEMQEAITAGESALRSLKTARDRLNSARSWGIADLLGGGLLTGMVKHSRMNEAAAYMEEAKKDLLMFQRELKDVNVPLDLRMEVGGFLSFADFFFDGVVADYLVQSRIADARAQVADAIGMVEILLRDLKERNV